VQKPRCVAIMLDLDWSYKRHSGIFAGTQVFAQESGWYSIIDECVEEKLSLRKGIKIPYDGIIARVTKKLEFLTTRLKIPTVNVWLATPVKKKLPSVYPDYAAVGRLRAEHLLSRGLIRFVTIGPHENPAHLLELNAFSKRLRESGFSCINHSLPLAEARSKNWTRIERDIHNFMSLWKPPIGVFIAREIHGRILVQLCQSRGWRVPQDISIITGSNEDNLCESLHPTLSSVEIGYERVGYEAAKLLGQLMDRRKPDLEPILIQPTGLVVRESTALFTVDDEAVAAALKFISENYHKDIGLEDVARVAGMESRTLQRRFQKYLKRPVVTEIRRVRIERAKQELAQGDRTIAEIARISGFGKSIRMYEVFKREFGITPTEYRRERKIVIR
jgi:LacI family transcriptional regulator